MKEQVVYTIKINIEVYRSIVLNGKFTAEGEWGGGNWPPVPSPWIRPCDSTNSDDPEPELEMPENVEPSLPPVRRSNRQRNRTDFYQFNFSFWILSFIELL